MSDIVIKAENIGKVYKIKHQASSQNYVSIRDVAANSALNSINSIKKYFKKSTTNIQNDVEAFWALQSLDFEISKGDVVGIIGRNGAGKSTLLKILSRITEPSVGVLKVKGRIASLLEVGTGFHPELTGRENIFLNGAILGMSRLEIKSKFDEIVDFAGVEKFLDTPVKRYSSGMYVRLAFSVAAHLEPEILVVDEVLAVGDSDFQKKCLGKLDQVSKNDGRTILFVSHHMLSIQQLCNKGILLQNGKIKYEGDINEVIKMYENVDQSDFMYKYQSLKTGSFFQEITLLNNKIETSRFSFYDDINILIKFSNEVSKIPGIFLVIQIRNIRGVLVYSNEWEMTSNFNIAKNVSIKIPKHHLMRDKYSLDFHFQIPKQTVLETINDKLFFEIIDYPNDIPVIYGDNTFLGNSFIPLSII